MADTIAVMNNGLIEQLGAPIDMYERPASVFVADFIGSPAMNFLPFEAALHAGAESIQVGDATVAVPQVREDVAARQMLCGVRPEHVRLSDASALRGEILGTEYLGTSQVITIATALGSTLRAKVSPDSSAARGDHVGLAFDAAAVSLFDQTSGRALRTARDDAPAVRRKRQTGAAHHG